MEEYKYSDKLDIELEDRLLGVGIDDHTYNFRVSLLAAFISKYVNVDIATKLTIKDLGTSDLAPEKLINILPPFSPHDSEIVIFKKNDTDKGHQLYLFLLPAGTYGSGHTQVTANDILMIEREYTKITVDTILNITSENPVQNKVILEALNDKASLSGNNTFNGTNTFTGPVTVTGAFIRQNVTDIDISDNVILINKGEQGNGVSARFAGIQIDRGTAKDYAIMFSEDFQTLRSGWFDTVDGNVQTSTRTTITLDANDLGSDALYRNDFIKIFKANEIPVTAQIQSYDPVTKIATLQTPFTTGQPLPDNTWKYRIVVEQELKNIPNITNNSALDNNHILVWDGANYVIKDSGTSIDDIIPLIQGGNVDNLHKHSYLNLENLPTVDAVMSGTSTNPVENKTMKTYIDTMIGNIPAVNLSLNQESYQVTIQNSGGDNVIIPAASTTLAGIMQANDKIQLSKIGVVIGSDGIERNPADVSVGARTDLGKGSTISKNNTTIGGGLSNVCTGSRATIGGGLGNKATGNIATIPGGVGLTAAYDSQFVCGRFNKNSRNNAFELGGGGASGNPLNLFEITKNGHVITTGDILERGTLLSSKYAKIHGNKNQYFYGQAIAAFSSRDTRTSTQIEGAYKGIRRSDGFRFIDLPLNQGGTIIATVTGEFKALNFLENGTLLSDKYAKINGDKDQYFFGKAILAYSSIHTDNSTQLEGVYPGIRRFNGSSYIDLPLNQGGTIIAKPHGEFEAKTFREGTTLLSDKYALKTAIGDFYTKTESNNKYAKKNGDVAQNFYANLGLFSYGVTTGQQIRIGGDKIWSEDGAHRFDLGLNSGKTILAQHNGTLHSLGHILNFVGSTRREARAFSFTTAENKKAGGLGLLCEKNVANYMYLGKTFSKTGLRYKYNTGAIELYHNDIKRLQTTATGVGIIGEIDATIFSVGRNSFEATSGYLTLKSRGNEMCIVATDNDTKMNVNYRLPIGLSKAIKTWWWRDGTSTGWAEFRVGSLYENGTLLSDKYAKKNGDVNQVFETNRLNARNTADGTGLTIWGNNIWGSKQNNNAYDDIYFGQHHDIILKDSGELQALKLRISNIPTADTGLSPGGVWSDNGTLKIKS